MADFVLHIGHEAVRHAYRDDGFEVVRGRAAREENELAFFNLSSLSVLAFAAGWCKGTQATKGSEWKRKPFRSAAVVAPRTKPKSISSRLIAAICSTELSSVSKKAVFSSFARVAHRHFCFAREDDIHGAIRSDLRSSEGPIRNCSS
jgi:hypothetical protein